jgi:hypothetical protein
MRLACPTREVRQWPMCLAFGDRVIGGRSLNASRALADRARAPKTLAWPCPFSWSEGGMALCDTFSKPAGSGPEPGTQDATYSVCGRRGGSVGAAASSAIWSLASRPRLADRSSEPSSEICVSWAFTDVITITRVGRPTVMHVNGVHDDSTETSHDRGRGFESRIAHQESWHGRPPRGATPSVCRAREQPRMAWSLCRQARV